LSPSDYLKDPDVSPSLAHSLTVGLEAIYRLLPLGLVLEVVPEGSFLIRIILIASYSLQRIFMHHRNS
jgi:hypothetical protein